MVSRARSEGLIARLTDIRRELPNAYPLAVSEYISPQSATLLRRNGLGYLDLSGNCYLSFDNVLIEKEGKPNLRPSTRPLQSLFAPRATRVIRVLLADPQRVWRLEELAKAAEVSLGHSHNVVKRLEDLSLGASATSTSASSCRKAGDLLDAWCDSYSYRAQPDGHVLLARADHPQAHGATWRRVAHAEGRRYAFTLHSGASLVAPNVRLPAIHCYLEGDPAPIAAGARASGRAMARATCTC